MFLPEKIPPPLKGCWEVFKNFWGTFFPRFPQNVIRRFKGPRKFQRLVALNWGPRDYRVKPDGLEEREARVWVHLSKIGKIVLEEDGNIFEIKDSYIMFNKKRLDLTTIEFDILSLLIESKNKTITREELVSSLSSLSSHRSLDNHIKNLEKR